MTSRPVGQDDLIWFAEQFHAIAGNMERVIQGKRGVIDLVVMGLLSEGHLLIEDVPGVGKTLLAKSLARSIHCGFQRVQFTPDLLPSDITGVSVWDRERGAFIFRAGPVFTNIVLGDEINRASPKTQAALLEAMEERQVTVDGTTRELPPPFMVIATQNPIEHEGTYPLPEAQLDRFMMRLVMGYPSRAKELEILETHGQHSSYADLGPVVSAEDVQRMVMIARSIYVSDAVKEYLVDTVEATRHDPDLLLGASPRATLFLQRAARTRAAVEGRHYVTPDDVKATLRPVLVHRMILRPEAQMRGASLIDIVDGIATGVPVPGSGVRA
ncbi:MAG: ATPase [Actinobacteria bacterium RBG_16_68_21]|nr:MAG: ATPase [Actinobacteria bacterium RBG_16_68_21]